MKTARRCFVLALTTAVVAFCIPQNTEAGFLQNDPVNSSIPLPMEGP